VSNTYQKKSRRAQPDLVPAEIAVPEQVIVSMAEIAGAATEGLLALAVGTGLQVMAAMFGEHVTRLCGPDGEHNPGRGASGQTHQFWPVDGEAHAPPGTGSKFHPVWVGRVGVIRAAGRRLR
jgi:hypothetical protein